MGSRRGVDVKPRTAECGPAMGNRFAWRNRGRKRFAAQKNLEFSGSVGAFRTRDYAPSGSRSGLVFGVCGPKGGISGNPAIAFSYFVRRQLRPRRPPADITVYDKDGNVLRVLDGATKQEKRGCPTVP